MLARSLLLPVFCMVFGEATSSAASASKICSMSLVPEEELKLLQNISARLDTFLDRNLDAGHQRLKKVLTTFGLDEDTTIKVDPEDPLESVILQYQMALHQDMKRMFFDLKKILSGRGSPDSAENEVDSNVSPSTVSSFEASSSRESSDLSISSEEKHSYSDTDYITRLTDCSELFLSGNTKSGIYEIYPFRCQCGAPVKVFCDMETDGGGWTVFLSRVKNTSKPVNFIRNWADYRSGFGTPGEEHWLGNEHLFAMTSSRSYILRMEAKDGFGREIWGEWTEFKVESEDNKFRATITSQNPKSTATNQLTQDANGQFFSTFDADNDKTPKYHCADHQRGGFWYHACNWVNPTGVHGLLHEKGVRVHPWSKTDSTTRYATWMQLKIRPKVCSSTISVANVNTHNCNFH